MILMSQHHTVIPSRPSYPKIIFNSRTDLVAVDVTKGTLTDENHLSIFQAIQLYFRSQSAFLSLSKPSSPLCHFVPFEAAVTHAPWMASLVNTTVAQWWTHGICQRGLRAFTGENWIEAWTM